MTDVRQPAEQANDGAMDLDSFLAACSSKDANNLCENKKVDDLESELQEYRGVGAMPAKESVISFWQNHSDRYPLLYKLAALLFQIPLTEVGRR